MDVLNAQGYLYSPQGQLNALWFTQPLELKLVCKLTGRHQCRTRQAAGYTAPEELCFCLQRSIREAHRTTSGETAGQSAINDPNLSCHAFVSTHARMRGGLATLTACTYLRRDGVLSPR